MLSYHADADIHTNPFELGLDRLVNLDMEAEFIGRAALRRIRDEGIWRWQEGLRLVAPRLEQNIALAMVAIESVAIGTMLEVETPGGRLSAEIVETPFLDPRKRLAIGG